MKILMSAYACEPKRGSEPGAGWNWALQAARFHEVWVLTRDDNRMTIEAELARNPRPGLHFIFHDLPKRMRFEHRSERLYAYLWELSAVVAAYNANRRIGFDVMHHVTFNSIEVPGLLWLLDPPFVWGPVGGAQEPPAAFTEYLGGAWGSERLRVYRKRLLRFNPLVRIAVRRTRVLMAANKETQKILTSIGGKNVRLELETAITPSPIESPVRSDHTSTLDLIWVGGLIPRKAPMLAIEAFETALSKGVDCSLTFVGDGPLRNVIEQRIRRSSVLVKHASVVGPVPYEDMRRLYLQADVFLFTSLNDTSGNVVLEAMSAGLPVIALNHQGVAQMVTQDTGIVVPVSDPEHVISDLAGAIETLAQDPDLRHKMGVAGRERVENELSWERKGVEMDATYKRLVESL